jgi:hypothetical protein
VLKATENMEKAGADERQRHRAALFGRSAGPKRSAYDLVERTATMAANP